ncbi:hypothetical protein PENTCL1PPCAC_13257, partial [Pristionchus entomophagus]
VEKKIPTTPQCILCEAYPKTTTAYAYHLDSQHKSTLISNGVYLLCACGIKVGSIRNGNHFEKCDGRQFTLHKLEKKTTPLCVLCEAHPTTVNGYVQHLYIHHKSTLNENGIFLLCSCGKEVRHSFGDPNHNNMCDGREFTIHKIVEKVHTTPQCIMCEVFPTTARGYATHLYKYHKSTLGKNGFYLVCSCGKEVRSYSTDPDRTKKCDGLQFNLLKLEEKIHSTPQCILCEIYPTTAPAYAYHLYKHHKSTLKTNGIFLLCACGMEARSTSSHRKHNGECDGRQFTVQKLKTPQCVLCEEYPTTANGFAIHLQMYHNSTLRS